MSLKSKPATINEDHLRKKLKKLMEESEKLKAKKFKNSAEIRTEVGPKPLNLKDSTKTNSAFVYKPDKIASQLPKPPIKIKKQLAQKQQNETKRITSNTLNFRQNTRNIYNRNNNQSKKPATESTFTGASVENKSNMKNKVQSFAVPISRVVPPLPQNWNDARPSKIINSENTEEFNKIAPTQSVNETHVKEEPKAKPKLIRSVLKRPADNTVQDSTDKKIKKVQINENSLNGNVPAKQTPASHPRKIKRPTNIKLKKKTYSSKSTVSDSKQQKEHEESKQKKEDIEWNKVKKDYENSEKTKKGTEFHMKGFFGKRDITAFGISDPQETESDSDIDYADVIDKFLNTSSTDDDDLIYFGSETDDSFDTDSLDKLNDDIMNQTANINDNILNSTDDSDYELPPGEVEDLIVHRGTAQIHALKPEQNKLFDNIDDEESKLVEIKECQPEIKTVTQPKEYSKEELLKLSVLSASTTSTKVSHPNQEEYKKNLTSESPQFALDNDKITDTCPKLVPITKDVSETESNAESEISSQMSVDINTKYLYTLDDYYLEDYVARRKPKLPVDIVDATKCESTLGNVFAEQHLNKTLDENSDAVRGKQGMTMDFNKKCTVEFVQLFDDEETNNSNLLEPTAVNDTKKNTRSGEGIENVTRSTLENNTLDTDSKTNSNDKISDYEDCEEVDDIVSENFKTIFYNSIDTYNVIVLVKNPFYIYGTVKLELVAGAIEVYGHTPKPCVNLEIFSPRGYSLIKVSPCPAPDIRARNKNVPLNEALAKWEDHFLSTDLKELHKQYEPSSDAIIVLQRNVAAKKLVHNFRMFMNENVFPNMQNMHKERPFGATEHLLQCIINSECDKALRIPREWSQIPMAENSKIMLIGGKAVGKSTLLRYLVNRHLSKHNSILLIDLDIGQAEIFVPQTISYIVLKKPIIGPAFFLNQQPDKSYFVGHSNVTMCPYAYMKCVEQLINDCKDHEELLQMPWVINTMGYNKGFATELLQKITLLLNPTDIIQLQSNKEANNFDMILQPNVLMDTQNLLLDGNIDKNEKENEDTMEPISYRLHVLQTAVQNESRYQQNWSMSAKDMRYAMILSRLSVALRGNSEWLTDCKPICAPMSDLKLINTVTDNQDRNELLQAMEANLVYLCHYLDDEKPLECLGIGVVRAIDYNLEQIYLLPAVDHSYIARVNCLAIGEVPLPNAMFVNQGPKIKENVPFVYKTFCDNATKAIKQIFHRPVEFLTAAHKKLVDN